MTRRHYEALAKALAATKPSTSASAFPTAYELGQAEQWRADVHAIADACAEMNEHFNRARFLSAAGCD